MENIRLILCTFTDTEAARQIGTSLVEKQLAACVNLVPGIESIYRWQGAVESAAEVLGIFKTTAAALSEFEAELVNMHPYAVPEIVVLEPAAVSAAYQKWLLESVVPAENS